MHARKGGGYERLVFVWLSLLFTLVGVLAICCMRRLQAPAKTIQLIIKKNVVSYASLTSSYHDAILSIA
jgi:hypothetical protein